ncbi:LPXTG cell wall anchor domain-containing protein [Kitasatospora putterlickiae]|uniref:LPXTG cell wall anchor domain-containing protein n=1 Tax=Kitasatospora putterlickiae TaxID=221725 RepID=UPI003CD083FB
MTVAAPAPPVDLASTGGSSTNTPMAITGATSIAMGIGTLVVARRRQKSRPVLAATRAPGPAPTRTPPPRPPRPTAPGPDVPARPQGS